MRHLQAAVLFAVPALTAPVATSSELNPIVKSEFVQLALAVGEDGFEITDLQLDIHATDKPCDPSAISINGNRLSINGDKSGSGVLTLMNGLPITAEWQFTCDDPSQFMDMTILSFDGDEIPGLSFTTHLLHSPQTSADTVTVGPSHTWDAPATEFDADALRELRHKELKAEFEASLNADGVPKGTTTVDDAAEEAAASIKDCDTSRCMWQLIKAKVKATAQGLRQKVIGTGSAGSSSTMGQSDGDVHEQPLADGFASQQAPSEHRPGILASQDIMGTETPREALVSALLLAVFAFSLFTLFSLLYTHRERIRTALAERRARRRAQRLRTWAERRAARKARKEAVRNFICSLFRSLVDFDAEKRAAEEERRQALAERQAEEGRCRVQDDQDTSMEQELAGLRAAAAMVDELVSGWRPAAQQQESQPPPIPPRPPITGFVTYDDRLPTYEEQIHDSAVVADGFRFAPGPRAPEPQAHLPVPERSSDRLGYNK